MFRSWKETFDKPLVRRGLLDALLFCVLFGGFLLYAWVTGADRTLILIGVCALVGLLFIMGLTALIRRLFFYRIMHAEDEESEPVLRGITLDLIQHAYMPVLICDEKSKIIWFNNALATLYHAPESMHGRFLDQFTSVSIQDVMSCDAEEGIPAVLSRNVRSVYADRRYLIRGYHLSSQRKNYYITFWNNKTDLAQLEKRLDQNDDVVAFINIDNLEEMQQFAQEKYRIAAALAESALRRFADSVCGILKEYEKDRFILIFKAEHLQKMLDGRFPIMDEIREIRADDNMPVTLSIGLSRIAGTLTEKEAAARAALDTALQRGGDQAVFKTADNMEFYGGRTKTLQKRTKVRSRVIATELEALISKSENVLIMAHSHPDHDAIGSCVGLARLAMYHGIDAKIAIDKDSVNIRACLAALDPLPDYASVFVETAEIADYIRPGTLLLITDVCNPKNFAAPELYENVRRCVIIDHHRKATDLAYAPEISYIEPAASSASELVAEILEQSVPSGTLRREEADLLMAGILLDTDQFTRNTGSRTFSAALYLRGEGADPGDAKRLFSASLDDFMREAKFQSNIVIYRAVCAITYRDSDGTSYQDCIAAAKTANKLLMLDGVAASFALVRVGDTVHISARSQGEINVQLILEQLHGGGHFDAAAAQIQGGSMAATMELLKQAIDRYLDNN